MNRIEHSRTRKSITGEGGQHRFAELTGLWARGLKLEVGPQSITQSALGLGTVPYSACLLAAPRHSKPRRPFTAQKSLLTERLLRRLTAVCPLIGKLLTSPRGILIQLN